MLLPGSSSTDAKRQCMQVVEVRRRLEESPRVKRVLEKDGFLARYWQMCGATAATDAAHPALNCAPSSSQTGAAREEVEQGGARWRERVRQAGDARWRAMLAFENGSHNPFLALEVAAEQEHVRRWQLASRPGAGGLDAMIERRLKELEAKLGSVVSRPLLGQVQSGTGVHICYGYWCACLLRVLAGTRVPSVCYACYGESGAVTKA
eukprot:3515842-Rhodomonas_salina.8